MSTTSSTLTVQRDEYGGVVTLAASLQNDDGPLNWTLALPATFGDCLVYSVRLHWSQIATAVYNNGAVNRMSALLVNPTGSTIAAVGTAQIAYVGDTANGNPMAAQIEVVRPPALWRTTERLVLEAPEQDSNGAPTVDIGTYVRVLRLRNTPDAIHLGSMALMLG